MVGLTGTEHRQEAIMESRDQYVENLKNKLDEWNEQIGKTEAQMN